MNLRPIHPLETFHAARTKRGGADAWDGRPYVMLNQLKVEAGDGEIVEIMLDPGRRTLVAPPDLRPVSR